MYSRYVVPMDYTIDDFGNEVCAIVVLSDGDWGYAYYPQQEH